MSSTTLVFWKLCTKVFAVNFWICILIFATLASSQRIIPNGPYLLHPQLIRPVIVSNVTKLLVPRGGAYVQPLRPIDNSIGDVTINLTVGGEACELGDPLVLFFEVTTTGDGAFPVVVNFINAFYFSPCGELETSTDLSVLQRWAIPFLWDGTNFVSTDIC